MKAREFPFIRTPFAILSLLGVLAFGSVSLARVSQAVPGDGRGDALITNFHGTQYLLSTFAAAGKYFANASITAATADENGTRLSIGASPKPTTRPLRSTVRIRIPNRLIRGALRHRSASS